jgi:hypothetical protein
MCRRAAVSAAPLWLLLSGCHAASPMTKRLLKHITKHTYVNLHTLYLASSVVHSRAAANATGSAAALDDVPSGDL